MLVHDTRSTPPPTSLARRDVLRMSLAAGGALAATPLLARVGGTPNRIGTVSQQSLVTPHDGDTPSPPAVTHFSLPLKILPVLAPASSAGGINHYEIRQVATTQQILPDRFPATPIFGFNGTFPGPTIQQTRGGDLTVVHNVNALPKGNPYSTHLHGSPNQPFYDGHPLDLVSTEKTYHYPNNESARTLWYHDHAINQTADHVYRGLVAFFLHQPAAAERTQFSLDDLPSGDHDIPLVVSDIQFTQAGDVFFDDNEHVSLLGNVMLVNGVPWPFLTVDKALYRFRILHAALSRGLMLSLSNGMPMTVIGTDSGLVRTPAPVRSIRMGTAERYEVVIDFSQLATGTKVTLQNTAASGQMRDVMQFVVAGRTGPSARVPSPLAAPDLPVKEQVVRQRTFRFEREDDQWVINGLPWDNRVVAAVKANTTERWFFENDSGDWFHPVHVHLVDFVIASRNGRPPFAFENGLKDTAYVGPDERLELLMRFVPARPVDPAQPVLGKYVMHCHNLVHEDHAMMSEFDVQPGAAGSAHAASPRMDDMMVQFVVRA